MNEGQWRCLGEMCEEMLATMASNSLSFSWTLLALPCSATVSQATDAFGSLTEVTMYELDGVVPVMPSLLLLSLDVKFMGFELFWLGGSADGLAGLSIEVLADEEGMPLVCNEKNGQT